MDNGKIITNSSAVLWNLGSIMNFKTYDFMNEVMVCQVPPRYMNVAMEKIGKGIHEQIDMNANNLFILGSVGPQQLNNVDRVKMKVAADSSHDDDEKDVAWDDVSGAALKPELVRQARKSEMEYFERMKVYKKVLKKKCYEMTGKAPIGVRWIDVNKQDDENPLYRSRLVAKDFNNYKDPDLFTATPPLELLRLIVSIAASKRSSSGSSYKIMVNDVSRAYFYAPSQKPTFVEICDEDFRKGDEEMCGELLVSMYGTRPAAGNWQKCYTEVLIENGFTTAASSTCIFYHKVRDIRVFVHGDDFVSTADGKDLLWLKGVLSNKFEIKTTIIGHDDQDEKRVKILNRIITVVENGFDYEPDIRHAELVVKELGLENSKAVTTPWCDQVNEPDAGDEMDETYKKRYQSISARLNFLALDRMDIQFSSKECARKMSCPNVGDWGKLKRLGRYLKGCPRMILHYEFQEWPEIIEGMSDANWALDKETRKSTSGGVIMFGKHYIKSWSKTQSLVALSSAESELYALIKCTSEVFGIKSAMSDWGMNISAVMKSDASAALGIVQRQGLGKVRHIDCSYLYIQQVCAAKTLAFAKIPGAKNPADLCTKGLCKDKIEEYIYEVGGRFYDGRSGAASKLQS
jgi:hypothetical protein